MTTAVVDGAYLMTSLLAGVRASDNKSLRMRALHEEGAVRLGGKGRLNCLAFPWRAQWHRQYYGCAVPCGGAWSAPSPRPR